MCASPLRDEECRQKRFQLIYKLPAIFLLIDSWGSLQGSWFEVKAGESSIILYIEQVQSSLHQAPAGLGDLTALQGQEGENQSQGREGTEMRKES